MKSTIFFFKNGLWDSMTRWSGFNQCFMFQYCFVTYKSPFWQYFAFKVRLLDCEKKSAENRKNKLYGLWWILCPSLSWCPRPLASRRWEKETDFHQPWPLERGPQSPHRPPSLSRRSTPPVFHCDTHSCLDTETDVMRRWRRALLTRSQFIPSFTRTVQHTRSQFVWLVHETYTTRQPLSPFVL